MNVTSFVGAALAMALNAQAQTVPEVLQTRRGVDSRLGITVLTGQLEVPAQGLWVLEPASVSNGRLGQLQLVTPPAVLQRRRGKRLQEIDRQARLQEGNRPLHLLYHEFRTFAEKHKDQTSVSFEDLPEDSRNRIDQLLKTTPWKEPFQLTGPYFALIPQAVLTFKADDKPYRQVTNAEVMAIELHPYLDDGKHWVLRTNGRTERLPIDPALMEQHGMAVAPVPDDQRRLPPATALARYQIYALQVDGRDDDVRFSIANQDTGEKLRCRWSPEPIEEGSPEIVRDWAQARAEQWRHLAHSTPAPVLKAWLAAADRLYDASPGKLGGRRPDRARTTNAFNMFGGRTAIRETLQMDLLEKQQNQPGGQPVPIESVKAVEVESHPFAEMLGDAPGGLLPLADYVPADRFFVYAAKPEAFFPLLDQGAEFLFQAGAVGTGSSISRGLVERYLARLGMNRQWLKLMLHSGAIRELGVVLPELFLIDGTDVTVLARIPSLGLAAPLLKMIGVGGLGSEPTARRGADGRLAYWAMSGDLLVISTNRQELNRVIATGNNPDASLGRSAEFRYMLTQLPLTASTRLYTYFSDPFIRRLVGPEVKIGQLRRVEALAELELITAGALLYRLDGHAGVATLTELQQLGYLPKTIQPDNYRLRADLVAESTAYGTLLNPAPLSANPVMTATSAEATAYGQYLQNYNRYWRRFFDPIAIRLDDTPDAGLELEVFILPLLDNSMYNSLRESLVTDQNQAPPLRIPQLEPAPVMTLSLNLSEKTWTQTVRDLSRMLSRYTGVTPTGFDQLGPGVHLAIQDSNPLIALGSGDVLGMMGGNLERLGRGGEMLSISFLLTCLTRPCSLLVELREAEQITNALRQAAIRPAPSRAGREMGADFCQIDGRDQWIYTVNFLGMVKLRFGLSVQGDFLVISNVPWSQNARIASVASASLNAAAMTLRPGAVHEQLPALFTTAMDQQRDAAMHGLGYLYPLAASGVETVEALLDRHRNLFGFVPVHPGTGTWTSHNGHLQSSVFGMASSQRQPAYQPGQRQFGLFQDLEYLKLNLQFEDTGLRSQWRWKLSP